MTSESRGETLAIGLTPVMVGSMLEALNSAGYEKTYSFTSYREAMAFLKDTRGTVVIALLDCGDQEFAEAKDAEGVKIQDVVAALVRQSVRIVLVNRNALNNADPIPGIGYVLNVQGATIDRLDRLALGHVINRIPAPQKA